MKKHEGSKLEIAFPFITVALVIGGAIILGVLSGRDTGETLSEQPSQLDNSLAFFKGSEEAKVVITEFSDFQCPACRRASLVLNDILKKYPQETKLYLRHFPIPGHSDAQKAAEAAEAAGEQGKFWEMHDKLFENQENIKVENLKKYAEELELNMEQFNLALESSTYRSKVLDDKNEGLGLGVNATPTIFLNGKKIDSVEFDNLETLIKQELKDK